MWRAGGITWGNPSKIPFVNNNTIAMSGILAFGVFLTVRAQSNMHLTMYKAVVHAEAC